MTSADLQKNCCFADTHGGIGTSTAIYLGPIEGSTRHIIVLQWNHPGTYTDAVSTTNVDATPGTLVRQLAYVFISRSPCQTTCQYEVLTHMNTVEWVSTDIAGISARQVDEDDFAELIKAYPSSVVWGFTSDGGQGNRTYHLNVAPFSGSANYIDSSDLSAMAADLDEDTCELSKVTQADPEPILEWFGVAATGRDITIVPNGEPVPEYDVVDWDQARQAMADPSGFRRNTSGRTHASRVEWTRVKQLFK